MGSVNRAPASSAARRGASLLSLLEQIAVHAGHVPHVMADAMFRRAIEVLERLLRIALGLVIEPEIEVRVKELAIEQRVVRIAGAGGVEHIGRLQLARE